MSGNAAIAAGIDLGGTKIETQVFGAGWQRLETARVDTPKSYEALVEAIAGQVHWAVERVGAGPVGLGAAGRINPATGLALAANLPVTGRPFPADIAAAAGRPVTLVNDCRAFALSEAVFGAAKGASPAVGLILGTGVGGGVVVEGALVQGLSAVGGEFGHAYAPAHIVVAEGLPIHPCGCGRTGCFETYVAGPGLERMAAALTGRPVTTRQIAEGRGSDPALARVWDIWCRLTAEMMMTMITMIDPEVVVLGGGLSKVPRVAEDIAAALGKAQLGGFSTPRIVLAEGGEASGARGAAYAAMQEAGHV